MGGAIQRLGGAPGRRDGATWPSGSTSRACCAPASSTEAAAHLLWVLTSFDAFDLLYTGRGLPADEVAEALIDTAERTLLR